MVLDLLMYVYSVHVHVQHVHVLYKCFTCMPTVLLTCYILHVHAYLSVRLKGVCLTPLQEEGVLMKGREWTPHLI